MIFMHYLPTNCDVSCQDWETNPPNTCPSVSSTTIKHGPLFNMRDVIAEKLSPWIRVLNRKRQSPRRSTLRVWLRNNRDGRSSKVVSFVHGTLLTLGTSGVFCIMSTCEWKYKGIHWKPSSRDISIYKSMSTHQSVPYGQASLYTCTVQPVFNWHSDERICFYLPCKKVFLRCK